MNLSHFKWAWVISNELESFQMSLSRFQLGKQWLESWLVTTRSLNVFSILSLNKNPLFLLLFIVCLLESPLTCRRMPCSLLHFIFKFVIKVYFTLNTKCAKQCNSNLFPSKLKLQINEKQMPVKCCTPLTQIQIHQNEKRKYNWRENP